VADSYETLSGVYEWLPEPLLTPQGSAAAFADVVDTLPARARVLDCAAGIGQLAVGLARLGGPCTSGLAGILRRGLLRR